MDIEGHYLINASREQTWQALNDPDTLRKCIPGCETLEKLSETEFQARVKMVQGPVRAKFDMQIKLENLNPPESYTLTGEAKAAAAGFGRGSAHVRLTEQLEATELHYSAEFKVGGKLAQIGSRLVLGATRKTVEEFFGNFSKTIDSESVRLHVPTPKARMPRKVQVALAAGFGMLLWWFLLR